MGDAFVSDLKTREAPFGGMTRRMLGGTFWLTAGSGVEQGLRFLRNIVLARLLSPETFGSMAIVIAVSSLLDAFTQVGVREFLIQNPDSDDTRVLNGAWWFSVGRGAVLYGAAFVLCPLIAAFYGNPSLVPLLRIALLGLLFRAVISTRAYLILKRMEFKKWILIEQAGGSIGVATAILFSLVLHSVWGLVIGFAVEAFAQAVMSFVVSPYLPRFRFDPVQVKKMFTYARGMFGIPVLVYICLNADIFVIGKLRSPAELGLYSMALSLAQVPLLLMDKIIGPLFMPVFSQMQTDTERIGGVVQKTTLVFGCVLIPSLVFVSLYGAQILTVFYGGPYAAIASAFVVLYIMVIVRTMSAPLSAVYLSLGHPMKLRYYTLLRAGLTLAFIYPAVKLFGVVGAAGTALLAFSLVYVLQIAQLHRLIGIKFSLLGKSLLPSLPFAALLFIVWGATSRSLSARPLLMAAFGLCALVIVYAAMLVLALRSPSLRRLLVGMPRGEGAS